MLDSLGKREKPVLPCRPDCDMRRVLMTQMGLVTMVLLAPAIIEDQKLTTIVLPFCKTVIRRVPKNLGAKSHVDITYSGTGLSQSCSYCRQ